MATGNSRTSISLPEPSLRRLPWYLAYVKLLRDKGVEYVSSTQISKEINVDASQIAKDLSFINISGKTRVGYEVGSLVDALEKFWVSAKNTKPSFSVSVVWGRPCCRIRGWRNTV